jgi:prolipoprotein diacylglyceryltransferase
MTDELFVSLMAIGLLIVLIWGFLTLPGERWQVLAVLPGSKRQDRSWNGINLTYYGVFVATAYTLAVAIAVLLFGAVSMSWESILLLIAALLAVCVPSSRIIAGLVERKKHTLTVGGASFVGILATPWVAWAMSATGRYQVHATAVCAACCIAYVFGEGLGRLACISFGCCYGKPLPDVHPALRRLFSRWYFVFSGPTKKISYASGLEGRPVVPVQALTALISTAAGLAGMYLFLKENYLASFLLPLSVSQVWRVASEMLRADHRGGGTLSAYQWMALLSVPYAILAALLLPAGQVTMSTLDAGLGLLWSPLPLLLLQAFWIAIFLWTGRSRVTGAILSLHVNRDRI